MAYLRKRKGSRGTTWEVLFYVTPPKRHTVRLGRVNERIANTAKIRIEALVAAKVAGHSVDAETAGWVSSLHNVIHQRIAQAGLVEPRSRDEQQDPSAPRLARHIEKYIASRAKLKPNTIRNYKTTKRLLSDYFGKERLLRSIHAGHAKDYREWLVSKYSPATVSREIKRARQFFEYAKDCRIIENNPFAKVKAGSQKNTKRKHFVSPDVIQKVLVACPDNNWRLVIVLTRFCGLRIPSEVSRLTWGDVDWHGRRLTIRVPKKEHLDGHETRYVPIFAEVEPYLRQAFDEAPAGSIHVLPQRFHREGYVYAGILRAVERANVARWPKLLVNLRASRETELMKQDTAHLVHAWIGNTGKVAEDHYLMVTDEDFLRAASRPSAIPTPEPTPSVRATAHQESSPEMQTAASPGIPEDAAVSVPPRGVEPRFSD
jgi:integrase